MSWRMRKIKLYIASSLDSFIADENGNIDWLFSDADYGYTEFYNSIDTILVGRKTYEQSLTFDEDPYKGKKVYVFTHNNAKEQKQKKTTSYVEYVDKDIPEFVRRLLQQPFSNGGDIWLLGGGKILSLFLNADLVDEIILSVHPIILGKGIPLFNNIEKSVKLRLLESIPFECGLVQLRYCILN
jgi:dihydrofolate reductase